MAPGLLFHARAVEKKGRVDVDAMLDPEAQLGYDLVSESSI